MTNTNEKFNGKFSKEQIEKGLKGAGWDPEVAERFHDMVEKYNAKQDEDLKTLQPIYDMECSASTNPDSKTMVDRGLTTLHSYEALPESFYNDCQCDECRNQLRKDVAHTNSSKRPVFNGIIETNASICEDNTSNKDGDSGYMYVDGYAFEKAIFEMKTTKEKALYDKMWADGYEDDIETPDGIQEYITQGLNMYTPHGHGYDSNVEYESKVIGQESYFNHNETNKLNGVKEVFHRIGGVCPFTDYSYLLDRESMEGDVWSEIEALTEFNAVVEIRIEHGEDRAILADYCARIYAAFHQSYYLEMDKPVDTDRGTHYAYVINMHGFEK